MRRVVAISAICACLAVSISNAGRIFGDVKIDGKPVPAGIPVRIALVPPAAASESDTASPGARGAGTVPAAVADSTSTDKFGSYKLVVKGEGKCILTLTYDKQNLALDVFSYKEATRYDLVLEKKEGKLALRRK